MILAANIIIMRGLSTFIETDSFIIVEKIHS